MRTITTVEQLPTRESAPIAVSRPIINDDDDMYMYDDGVYHTPWEDNFQSCMSPKLEKRQSMPKSVCGCWNDLFGNISVQMMMMYQSFNGGSSLIVAAE